MHTGNLLKKSWCLKFDKYDLKKMQPTENGTVEC